MSGNGLRAVLAAITAVTTGRITPMPTRRKRQTVTTGCRDAVSSAVCMAPSSRAATPNYR